jgi:integrase
MMHQLPAPIAPPLYEKLISQVCRTVSSPHSKKSYGNALRNFFEWLETQPINRDTVLRYKEYLERHTLSPSTISLRLTVVRQLSKEAKLAGAIDQSTWEGIAAIAGPHREGRKTGNWLTASQAERLIEAPPADTLRGKRDRAILATLIGCGLRRAELCSLTREQIQQRDGRWVIVDILGKGQRTRTVPMPAWAKALIDEWWFALGFDADSSQYAFRSLSKGTGINGNGLPSGRTPSPMSRNAVFELVQFWSEKAGAKVAPHDLRRTFSKLALRGKADLHQIQLTLGHASIQTTERYLGTEQDLSNAPCDVLGIEVELPGGKANTL